MSNAVLRTRAELAKRFPECFAGKGQAKRPLKEGIRQDIRARAPDLNSRDIKNALYDYVSGPLYLLAMKEGAERIDLDGQVVGAVTKEEAAHVAQRLDAIRRQNAQWAAFKACHAALEPLAMAARAQADDLLKTPGAADSPEARARAEAAKRWSDLEEAAAAALELARPFFRRQAAPTQRAA